jgi:hypothetical protein
MKSASGYLIAGLGFWFATFGPCHLLKDMIGPSSQADEHRLDTGVGDGDRDGLADAEEQILAERFAPIVYHSSDESNFPTNVDWFLSKTSLWFYHYANPELRRLVVDKPSQSQLLGNRATDSGDPPRDVRSDGTRSDNKLVTFYLRDVAGPYRVGSTDSKGWVTYFHSYRNNVNGVTIQYWRFYAYNDAFNDHGGDWEGVHVVLDADLRPSRIGLLQHEKIEYKSFTEFLHEGNHPYIFSEGGGHGSRSSGSGIYARGCEGGCGGAYFAPSGSIIHALSFDRKPGQVARLVGSTAIQA